MQHHILVRMPGEHRRLVLHCCNCVLQFSGPDLYVFQVISLKILIRYLIVVPVFCSEDTFVPMALELGIETWRVLGLACVICCCGMIWASMDTILEVASAFRCYNFECYCSRHCSSQVGELCRGPSLLIVFDNLKVVSSNLVILKNDTAAG